MSIDMVCHEGMYANFEPTTTKAPNATIQELDTRKETNTLRQELLNGNTQPGPHTDEHIKEVRSVKVLREATINASMNEALPKPDPTFASQPENQGENSLNPEAIMDEDSLLEKIKSYKDKAKEEGETQYKKMVEALNKIRTEKLELTVPRDEGFGADYVKKYS